MQECYQKRVSILPFSLYITHLQKTSNPVRISTRPVSCYRIACVDVVPLDTKRPAHVPPPTAKIVKPGHTKTLCKTLEVLFVPSKPAMPFMTLPSSQNRLFQSLSIAISMPRTNNVLASDLYPFQPIFVMEEKLDSPVPTADAIQHVAYYMHYTTQASGKPVAAKTSREGTRKGKIVSHFVTNFLTLANWMWQVRL